MKEVVPVLWETHGWKPVQSKLKMDGSGMEGSDLAADGHPKEGNESPGQVFIRTQVWILFPKFLELRASQYMTKA